MALYLLSVKLCSEHVTAKVSYILRAGKYAKGEKKEELRESNSENLPSWAQGDSLKFWKAIERGEKPGQVQARSIILALPVELSKEQQREIVIEFCESCLKNHALTWAIHDSKSGQNPHVHICFSERLIDARQEPKEQEYCKQRKGYSKDRKITGTNRKQWLNNVRKKWEVIQNTALEKAGCEVRVSCESLEKQGKDREPEIHVGPEEMARYKRTGKKGNRLKKNEEIKSRNLNLERLKAELKAAKEELVQKELEYQELLQIQEVEKRNAERVKTLNERFRNIIAGNSDGSIGKDEHRAENVTENYRGEGCTDLEERLRKTRAAINSSRIRIDKSNIAIRESEVNGSERGAEQKNQGRNKSQRGDKEQKRGKRAENGNRIIERGTKKSNTRSEKSAGRSR